MGETRGCTIVLDAAAQEAPAAYRDTPLPFEQAAWKARGASLPPLREALPERLRQMRRLYEYGRESLEAKAKNFYEQGKFMENYEDELPWQGELSCYFPTYHDLTARQLRAYFSWRTKIRQGIFEPIPASAAYIYIYELLNGIGAASPEESLEKLKAFEAGFLEAGVGGDARMRQNLKRWRLELAVLKDLPPETIRAAADPALIRRDEALAVLRSPQAQPDEAVADALAELSGKKLAASPVLSPPDSPRGKKGRHLLAEIWRSAAAYTERGRDLFALCFGTALRRPWIPLGNAVFCRREAPREREVAVNECRRYLCTDGAWTAECFEPLYFDRNRLQSFLREAERQLRNYLKAGRALSEKAEDAWAAPLAAAVIEADRRAEEEAARPKIRLDLSGLEQIRQDALQTQESLLTEEERRESEAAGAETLREREAAPTPPAAPAEEDRAGEEPSPAARLLDPLQEEVLRLVLQGESPAALLQERQLRPSLFADAVNEALYDEIGDVVLYCENDRLSPVEEYREELWQLLGGTGS